MYKACMNWTSYLSDFLAHHREEPHIQQDLRRGGHGLKVHHQHHRKEEKEGEIGHNIPVELDLWRAVQASQSGPAVQRLHGCEITIGVTIGSIMGIHFNGM